MDIITKFEHQFHLARAAQLRRDLEIDEIFNEILAVYEDTFSNEIIKNFITDTEAELKLIYQ